MRSFHEKPKGDGAWINGGFFCLLSRKYLITLRGDDTVLEHSPLEKLAQTGKLAAFRHEGFWQPMDTLRDKNYLEHSGPTAQRPGRSGSRGMKFHETPIAGAWRIELTRFGDERGFFARGFCRELFEAKGVTASIAQANLSRSQKIGTLRGLHFQLDEHAETKIVRCTHGRVWDCLVDLREDSPTFRQWYGADLSRESGDALVVPEGCAHGFITLEEDSDVFYMVTSAYSPEYESGVRWNDPAFGIQWPIEPMVISDRDRAWPDVELSGSTL